MQFAALLRKAAEDDSCHKGSRRQSLDDGGDRNAGGTVGGKPIDAGRNRWKGSRSQSALLAELDRAAIAGGKKVVLAKRAAVPHWTYGVDHVSGGKPIALGDFGVARLAAVERPAFGKEVRPCGAMYRAVDAAPTKERRIRRVDDRINAQRGDVGNDDFEPRLADLTR